MYNVGGGNWMGIGSTVVLEAAGAPRELGRRYRTAGLSPAGALWWMCSGRSTALLGTVDEGVGVREWLYGLPEDRSVMESLVAELQERGERDGVVFEPAGAAVVWRATQGAVAVDNEEEGWISVSGCEWVSGSGPVQITLQRVETEASAAACAVATGDTWGVFVSEWLYGVLGPLWRIARPVFPVAVTAGAFVRREGGEPVDAVPRAPNGYCGNACFGGWRSPTAAGLAGVRESLYTGTWAHFIEGLWGTVATREVMRGAPWMVMVPGEGTVYGAAVETAMATAHANVVPWEHPVNDLGQGAVEEEAARQAALLSDACRRLGVLQWDHGEWTLMTLGERELVGWLVDAGMDLGSVAGNDESTFEEARRAFGGRGSPPQVVRNDGRLEEGWRATFLDHVVDGSGERRWAWPPAYAHRDVSELLTG